MLVMDILTITISSVSLLATIVGLWLLGNKKKSGFVIFTVSVLLQSILFFKLSNWFLFAQMFILAAFNMKNYFKWKKEETR
jgi:nicotinamide riboside transporter PnuC